MSGIRYSDVRGAVDQLLRFAEREYKLERLTSGSTRSHTPFGDDRKAGTLAFTLATVCFRSPEARKLLEAAIASKAREVALLEERTKKDARSYES